VEDLLLTIILIYRLNVYHSHKKAKSFLNQEVIKLENSGKFTNSIGTKNNPIILHKKLSSRPLLIKHMPTTNTPDFSKFSKGSGPTNHVLNIITAKELSLDEIKIALFIYELYCFDMLMDIELVVIRVENSVKETLIAPQNIYAKSPSLKEVKNIYAKSPSLKEVTKYPIPKTTLLEMLKKENVILEQPRNLLAYLNKLHDLGLITLTAFSLIDDIERIENNSLSIEYAFIELNSGIMNAKIHRRWGKPKNEKSVSEPSSEVNKARKLATDLVTISKNKVKKTRQ